MGVAVGMGGWGFEGEGWGLGSWYELQPLVCALELDHYTSVEICIIASVIFRPLVSRRRSQMCGFERGWEDWRCVMV